MVLTIAMSFVKNAVGAGTSELYNAFDIAFVSSDSCARSARAWGHMFSLIFSVQTPLETYFENLTFSLAELEGGH